MNKQLNLLIISSCVLFSSCATSNNLPNFKQPVTEPVQNNIGESETEEGEISLMQFSELKEGDTIATIQTSLGNITVRLFPEYAPKACENFTTLAKKGYYNGITFHRVINDFMIQGGDPRGNGTGGPGYKFADEEVPYKFDKPGYLAMANAGPNTNGSQFFITHVETPWLNGKHTIFGQVMTSDDQNVVNIVAQGDEIKSVKIIRQGADAEAFKATQEDWDALNKEAAAKAAKAKEAKYAAKIAEVEKKFPGFEKTANGIYYKTTKAGSGAKCGKGKHVYVAYKGYLVDGTVFDSSEGRGDLDFGTGAGQMIPGFDEMVQDMQKGETRTMVLPPDLAYGEQGYPGVIPPASYICFDVTLNRF